MQNKVYKYVNSRQEYQGRRLAIRYCEQPCQEENATAYIPESWLQAIEHIPANRHKSCWSKMTALRKHLADGGQLRNPDQFRTESDLPNGKYFYAIKVDKLRAYGWFSRRNKGVFYISHFAYKKGQKLAQEDRTRVIKNWYKIEVSEVQDHG